MKPKYGWIEQWQTEADEDDLSFASLLAGFCVLVSLIMVILIYLIALTPR